MDPVHRQLVSELVRLLCVELDMHYTDVELSESSDDAVRTIQVAAALLTIAGHDTPEIYGHIMARIAKGEREAKGNPGPN